MTRPVKRKSLFNAACTAALQFPGRNETVLDSNDLSIGVAGIALNNGNLGCQALAYSSIAMLERVARQMGVEFSYVLFEGGYDETKTKVALEMLCKKVNVDAERVSAIREVGWERARSVIRRPQLLFARHRMLVALRAVDTVFDLTQGDSFTDMYDSGRRMVTFARTRDAAFKTGVPVILGPQTIGPFNTEAGRDKARQTLSSAKLVIARDEFSSACAKQLVGIDVPVVTDLAFGLPYERDVVPNARCKRVGLNPSGLLVHDAVEGGFDTSGFKTDYDVWLDGICNWLDQTGWEVHLISHVIGGDYPICRRIKDAHPNFVLHEDFSNPVDAKSVISTMDVFVGSRMHATIAALSSGVPVVPVAYSRKFIGLFGSLGYNVIIDLRTMDTEDALDESEQLIGSFQDLRPKVEAARARADVFLDKTRDILAEYLSTLATGAK